MNTTPITRTDILPCPFCGSEGHTLLRGFRYPEGSSLKEPAINCPTCGCQGPEDSWNKRAAVSDLTKLGKSKMESGK